MAMGVGVGVAGGILSSTLHKGPHDAQQGNGTSALGELLKTDQKERMAETKTLGTGRGAGQDRREGGAEEVSSYDKEYPPVNVTLKLLLDFKEAGEEGSIQRAGFEKLLVQDLSRATGLPDVCFGVRKISPGSIIANVAIYKEGSGRGPGPFSVVLLLQQQISRQDPVLRGGLLTGRLYSVVFCEDEYDGDHGIEATAFSTQARDLAVIDPDVKYAEIEASLALLPSGPSELPSGSSSTKHGEMSPMQALDGLSSKVDIILSRLGPEFADKGELEVSQSKPRSPDTQMPPEMSEAMKLRDELVKLRDERRQNMVQTSAPCLPSIPPYESQPTLAVSHGGGMPLVMLPSGNLKSLRGVHRTPVGPAPSSADQTSNLSAGTLAEWRDKNESRMLAARKKVEGGHGNSAGANQGSPLSSPCQTREEFGGITSSTADGAGMEAPGRHRHLVGPSPSSPALLTSSIVRSAQEGTADSLSDGWARLHAKGPDGVVASAAAVRAPHEVLPSLVQNELGAYFKAASIGTQHHSIGSNPTRTLLPRRPSPMTKPVSSGMSTPAFADRAGKRSTPYARSSIPNQRLFGTRTESTGKSTWEEEEGLDPTAPVGIA